MLFGDDQIRIVIGCNTYTIPNDSVIEVTKNKITIIHNGEITEIDR